MKKFKQLKYRRCATLGHAELFPNTLTYFYKASQHDLDHFIISRSTGLSAHCKQCIRRRGHLASKPSTWEEGKVFWHSINQDIFFQRLNFYIPGVSNFKENLGPVPLLTYTHLAKIHPRRRNVYACIFQYYFTYKQLNLRCLFPEFGLNYLITNPYDVDKNVPDPQLVINDIVWGLRDLNTNVAMAKQFVHLLTPKKLCATCKKYKETFLGSTDVESMAVLLDAYLAGKKPYITPTGFARGYQSRDGWKVNCRKCEKDLKGVLQ